MSQSLSQKLDETLRKESTPQVTYQSRFSRSLLIAVVLFAWVIIVAFGFFGMNKYLESQISQMQSDTANTHAEIDALKSNPQVAGALIYERDKVRIDKLIDDNNPVVIMNLLWELESKFGVKTKGFSYNDGRVTTTITADATGAAEGDALNKVIAFIAGFRDAINTPSVSPLSSSGTLTTPPATSILKLQPISSVSGNTKDRSFAVEFLTR